MTSEDTETLRKMYDEVMVLREFCKGLQDELTKKQEMLVDTRDELHRWRAKAEINLRDIQRSFQHSEIFVLPHGGLWCADLNCAKGRTDGIVYRYHPCGLCGRRLGDPTLDFRNDSRATAPPTAWTIGDLADARARGEAITCDVAYLGDARVPDSEGFCCGCDVGKVVNGEASRGTSSCDLFSMSDTAHCLNFDELWYSVFEVAPPQIFYDITVRLQIPSAYVNGWRNVTYSETTMTLSHQQPTAAVSEGTLRAELVGDLATAVAPHRFESKYLAVPARPIGHERVDANEPMKNAMLLDRSLFDLSGRTCDKIGVSYTAFRYQPEGCHRPAGSCLFEQLDDYHNEDTVRVQSGQQPQNLVSGYCEGAMEWVTEGTSGMQFLLACPMTQRHTTLMRLEARAESAMFVTNVAPGRIIKAEAPAFEALSGSGEAELSIINTGAVLADFTLGLSVLFADAPQISQIQQFITIFPSFSGNTHDKTTISVAKVGSQKMEVLLEEDEEPKAEKMFLEQPHSTKDPLFTQRGRTGSEMPWEVTEEFFSSVQMELQDATSQQHKQIMNKLEQHDQKLSQILDAIKKPAATLGTSSYGNGSGSYGVQRATPPPVSRSTPPAAGLTSPMGPGRASPDMSPPIPRKHSGDSGRMTPTAPTATHPGTPGQFRPRIASLQNKLFSTNAQEEQQHREMAATRDGALQRRRFASARIGESSDQKEISCVTRMVLHPAFDVVFALVVVTNSAYIGVEVQYSMTNFSDAGKLVFDIIGAVYALLFTIELVLRIWGYGCRNFFCSQDWAWSLLDTFIVLSSLWEVTLFIMDAFSANASDAASISGVTGLKAFRIVRLTKLVKTVRLMRIFRFVLALRMLITSILHTLKSLFWALVLLLLIVYVFAVLFVQAVHDHRSEMGFSLSEEEISAYDRYFESLPTTMVTLFMSISNGVSWENAMFPLMKISPLWMLCFLFFVSFTYFAVLNDRALVVVVFVVFVVFALIVVVHVVLVGLVVERRCRPDSHIMSRVYVDDRSFASSRAWSVHERFHQWSWWSASVGLLENQAKAVAVASTPARRATLRRILPDVVANDVELLGSCSMVSRRGLLHKETARVDACMRVLTLLACARLSFERYLRACRQFAISKIAYGWIARAPPLYLCNQLWSRVHVGSRRIRAASVWLRAALFGGGMHLDVLFATQLVGVLGRLLMKRSLAWSTRGGSPVHALDAWLLSHGWSRVRNWVWEHALSSHTLDLSVASDPGALQHIIRDAWRAWCLKRHMSSSRRDAQLDCFGDHGYFRRIDWIATRKFAASGPEARAIRTWHI
eukprot:s2779_g8.t1